MGDNPNATAHGLGKMVTSDHLCEASRCSMRLPHEGGCYHIMTPSTVRRRMGSR